MVKYAMEILWSSVIKMIYEHLEITRMLSHVFSIFVIFALASAERVHQTIHRTRI